MADQFTYRWKPGRLVGLGLTLTSDQAACAETEGYAMAVSPLMDPMGEEPIQLSTPEGLVCKPHPIKVVLNDLVPISTYGTVGGKNVRMTQEISRQEILDQDQGPEWRRYAQTVSESDGAEDYFFDAYAEEGPTNRFLWDTVMIDADAYRRLLTGITTATDSSQYPLWCEYNDIYMNGLQCDEEDHDTCECGWARLAEEFGISSAVDENGWPVEQPEWISGLIVPDYIDYLDDDLARLWSQLSKTSRQNWSAFESASGKSAPPLRGCGRYRSSVNENLWR